MPADALMLMLASLQVHRPLLGLGGHAHCIAAHPSDESIALGCGDNTIRVLTLAPASSEVSPAREGPPCQ